ncbi:MAG TPA: carboxypeptidase-like regulatory domain-containing protein [Gemmatimonadales bacterium]|jgi:hypothetical protein
MPRLHVQAIACAVPVLALTCCAAAAAQALRGDVRARESNLPLSYSTIAIEPGVAGRFTNDSGAFSFPDLARGDYRIVVRSIGYLPFDTVISVAGDPLVLHVLLRSLAIELPPVIVLARACLQPGPPQRDSEPELAAIFDQLRENAARYRLLSDAYPFRYWIERQHSDDPPPARGPALVVDTVERRSDARIPYKPGGLIINQPGPRGRLERTLRLPTVIDLADSVFHKAHCFSFGGIDTLAGRSEWRVDFLAAERLGSPDVAGSAWLDSDTYQLRQLIFRLTRPERAQRSLKNLEVTVAFGDLLPAVTVPVHIASKSEARRDRRHPPPTAHEEQRLLRVEFLNGRPGTQSP